MILLGTLSFYWNRKSGPVWSIVQYIWLDFLTEFQCLICNTFVNLERNLVTLTSVEHFGGGIEEICVLGGGIGDALLSYQSTVCSFQKEVPPRVPLPCLLKAKIMQFDCVVVEPQTSIMFINAP